VWARALGAPDGFIPREWTDPWDVITAIMFYGTAAAWTIVVTDALPVPAREYPLAAAAVLAAAFLAPAALRGHVAMHVAGIAVLALGVVLQWDGLPVAAVLVAPALLAAFGSRGGSLAANRWVPLSLMAIAAYTLFEVEAARSVDDPALTGRWALTMYLQVAGLLAIAGPMWKETEERWARPGGFPLRTATWLLAGLVALAGGTVEIPAFVVQRGGTDLGAGLAVSAYWLVFAGGLLAYGFRRERRAVRITGLAVAALAVGKVLVVDLAELRALYRVGSLALLAVTALLGARAYYRRQ
jgi:hypothetical protein